MKYKHIVAIPVLGLALAGTASAGYMPSLSPIAGVNHGAGDIAPIAGDWQFDQRGLTVNVASGGAEGGYILTATGSGSFTFGLPSQSASYAGTATGYTLTAHLEADTSGVLKLHHGSLDIIGNLNANPDGSTGSATTSDTVLYSADLTGFGVDKSHAEIGFTTSFNQSWSNQSLFTGGSTGEVVYLFDQVGLNNGGHGRLTSLINAISSNSLDSVVGKSYVGVESIASVPLPLPAILFGTGLTALMGLGRKGRGNAKSV